MSLNINFLDKKDSIKKSSNSYRKIKFRLLSFENISSMWKKMRKNALERKIEAKRENLVSMEFDEREVNGLARKKTEERILKKTNAIAKLESKLTFLGIGKYNSEKFINSRAIKLKDTMMNNLIFNKDCKYGLKEEVADQIMEENYVDDEALKEALEIEMQKIGNKVQEIMNESNENKSDITMQDVNSDSVASSVNNEFSKKEVIDIDEIKNIIDQSIEQHDVTPPISKVNKFIKDDGTYSMKKEDIDEEFRITRFDKEKPSIESEVSDEQEKKSDIQPFATEQKREIPAVELPKRALTEIVGRKHNFAPISKSPVIVQKENKDTEETATRVLPVVVPERKKEEIIINDEEVKPMQENSISPERKTTEKDLDPLITKVNILQAEQATTKKRAEEEADRATAVNRTYQETVAKFIEYADSLEADCNKNMQTLETIKAESDEKEKKINAMLEMMSAMSAESSEVRKGK